MPWWEAAAMAGNAIGQMGGSWLASSDNRKIQAQNRQFAAEMGLLEYQRGIEMWNRQNQYNTPANQMQRMKDAGLNTALMYGQGTVGNAENPPSPPKVQHESKFLPYDFSAATNMAQQMVNLKKSQAEVKNIDKAREILEEDRKNKSMQNELLENVLPARKDYEPKNLKASYDKMVKEMKQMDANIRKIDTEKAWNQIKLDVWRDKQINIDKDDIKFREASSILKDAYDHIYNRYYKNRNKTPGLKINGKVIVPHD